MFQPNFKQLCTTLEQNNRKRQKIYRRLGNVSAKH